jgi:hypothetical protein
MIIKTKYDRGDKVWFTYGFSYSFQVECLACTSTGSVTLSNSKIIKCGECQGTGEHRVYKPYKIRPQYGIITRIEYYYESIRYYIENTQTTNYFKEKELFETFFMARKKAHKDNKKYKWPDEKRVCEGRKEFLGHVDYPSRCYWGKRLRKNLNIRNCK